MAMAKRPAQELRVDAPRTLPAPDLPYQPRKPRRYHPSIGLIACGSITQAHLRAYRSAGFRVVALCDLVIEKARARQKEFFPDADVYSDYRDLLHRDDIEVVDIATHPRERAPLIRAALEAGKHVLSQKPFVVDLDVGEKLADLADRKGVRLAVNQNGRWAPYFSWMRQAVNSGLIGDPYAVHLACHWDHETALLGTAFDRIHHIIFYDFAIHWFDALHCLMGKRRALTAAGSVSRVPGQKARPPMLAEAAIQFEDGQASLVFDACTRGSSVETAIVVGTKGVLKSEGVVCNARAVELLTKKGRAVAKLTGEWFPDGFAGTMGELLCSVEEKRVPQNNARDNLESLALCFASIVSADTGKPQKVGAVRKPPFARCTPTAR
jgi:predicted dehydrogenase